MRDEERSVPFSSLIPHPSSLSVHHLVQPPSLRGVVEPQLVNAGRGAKARSAVASSDPEEGALPLAIPPRAHLLPARLDALDGIAALSPGESRRLGATPAQRHADRLLNPARHLSHLTPPLDQPPRRDDRRLAKPVLNARDRRPQQRPPLRVAEQAELDQPPRLQPSRDQSQLRRGQGSGVRGQSRRRLYLS